MIYKGNILYNVLFVYYTNFFQKRGSKVFLDVNKALNFCICILGCNTIFFKK